MQVGVYVRFFRVSVRQCVCVCGGGGECVGSWGACACAYVVLRIQHATPKIHIVTCNFWLHQIFLYYVINGKLPKKKKNSARYHKCEGAWGSVVVKALRY
jgi:hypothetical protein